MSTTENIAKLREAKGLTQVELAAKAGILQSSLSHYETGRRKPPLPVVVRIADALGCTVDDLIRTKETA